MDPLPKEYLNLQRGEPTTSAAEQIRSEEDEEIAYEWNSQLERFMPSIRLNQYDLEEKIKELEMKLKEKENLEEKIKRDMKNLEDDNLCNICTEMYVEPTSLNCGHLFCKYCINKWHKLKNTCPICVKEIRTTERIYGMDSMIEIIAQWTSKETQTRREMVIAERVTGGSPQMYASRPTKRRHCETPTHYGPCRHPTPLILRTSTQRRRYAAPTASQGQSTEGQSSTANLYETPPTRVCTPTPPITITITDDEDDDVATNIGNNVQNYEATIIGNDVLTNNITNNVVENNDENTEDNPTQPLVIDITDDD